MIQDSVLFIVVCCSIFSALEALVNFAYSGKVQISADNVQSLLIGANFLNLYEVKESCCEFITKR